MTSIVSAAVEVLALLATLAAAAVLARPFRRPRPAAAPEPGRPLRAFLAPLVSPLAVIGLSAALLDPARAAGRALAAAVGGYGLHFRAWMLFWLVVLAVSLLDGIADAAAALRRKPPPIPDLLRSILRTAVFVAAAFVILNRVLGRDISALLTSTALLTAVIGFALQGVLGNLLAGMSLHLVRSVVPGDWIAVEGVEGEVIETNWRETRLRTTGGHFIVVPNGKLAESLVQNLTRPTPVRRHAVNVGASYSDAPAEVIAALVASALSVPEVLRDPPPSAFATEYKDFGINYQLRFWSRRYFDRTPLEGDVNRMIWYQFKRRGIEIPFPMSDKLLNDFMEVVYTQRRLQSEDGERARLTDDLMASEFVTRILVDEKGAALVTREELRGVAEHLRRVRYTRGETIFRQGEAGESCYVVVRGRLQGRIAQEGVAEPHRFGAGPGAVIGEMSLMTGLPRTATVAAEEEVELLEIPREAFARVLGLRPEIPEVLASVVSGRAAANAEALEKLKAAGGEAGKSLERASLLKRFLGLLGRKV
jgi:small-conductance mechanosensitive channel/CRP-like cAMP-binding protein